MGTLTRTAPCRTPPDVTGTATYIRLLPSVSEYRLPVATSPWSALAISGRVAKSRDRPRVPSESARSCPRASTTTTRAPVEVV